MVKGAAWPSARDFRVTDMFLLMRFVTEAKRVLRGDVSRREALLEALRRVQVSLRQSCERVLVERRNTSAPRLSKEFARMARAQLLDHFRSRATPRCLAGFQALTETVSLQRDLFPTETASLIEKARRMTREHSWSLLGYGERCFGAEEIQWCRDPLSGFNWPLDYHADLRLIRTDGSDVRVLWELNRLGHLLILGRAYAVTADEQFAAEFFTQVETWCTHNPVGRGANWACAMEAALRAMNLLAAFALFRTSPELNEERLLRLLAVFDQHGGHIKRNLEFSYLATSNHYLSDVVGLLWLGLLLPELNSAQEWREWARREMLSEMEKQVLADGADFEVSTGYHRFVLELFLYSFLLCRANGLEIAEKYWHKLRAMFDYLRAYLRPDGRAPLIGDTDSGQVLPLVQRRADDHAYLLTLGAAVFEESRFKQSSGGPAEELLWILGADGLRDYARVELGGNSASQAFPDVGTYILRAGDLYLAFNASGNGTNGRGSHGHNAALSIEISACGQVLIVDPATYVYTADLHQRNLFRSTAYHSTVEVDGAEQNTTEEQAPFSIGDDAHPRVLRWETSESRDFVAAEHSGYKRLSEPVIHRRLIEFNKRQRFWRLEDSLLGAGPHTFRFRFHAAPGLELGARSDQNIELWDKITGARLFISALSEMPPPEFEPRFSSRDYGAKQPSNAVCWTVRAQVPLVVRFCLVPVGRGEDPKARLELATRLAAV